MNPCSVCREPARYECSRCHQRLYCGTTCQLRDWEQHIQSCRVTKSILKLANAAQVVYFEKHDLIHGDKWLNKRRTVLKKGDYVYKLARTEKEFLEIYTFYKRHRSLGIVPILVEADHIGWIIKTLYVGDRFKTLFNLVKNDPKSIDKEALQIALIRGLAKFKDPSFGKDMQANLRNIGYDQLTGEVIFYEDNGERYRYNSLPEMIFQFLTLMYYGEKGKKLLGRIKSIEEINVLVIEEERVFSENETASEE